MEVTKSYDYVYKCCFLGGPATGKSWLCSRFAGYAVDGIIPTVGATFITTQIKVGKGSDAKIVRLEVWDTAGTERYQSLAPLYYRSAHGLFVVYDIGDPKTLDVAKEYISTVKERVEKPGLVTIVLLGNKSDDVSCSSEKHREGVKEFCNQNDILFFETSAKTLYNLGAVIEGMLTGQVIWEDRSATGTKNRILTNSTNQPLLANPETSTVETQTVWQIKHTNVEDCIGGLLGKQRKEGSVQQNSKSYTTFGSDPSSSSSSPDTVSLTDSSPKKEGKKCCK
eukprot:TRINITY_DN528_c0_g1_i1.p1 TRINITY_DN528_c0_g1~~TRINITY_DN528_c0_g1_i1.p1  ORF type:complete len:281 (-),score=58.50 TRINITY_DN528_c0_g1_i1:133-975(-)